MTGKYAQILQDPKPYNEAGNNSIAEMSADFSDRAAKVLLNLPTDMRERFQGLIGTYRTYDELPADLKEVFDTDGASWTPDNGMPDSVTKGEKPCYSKMLGNGAGDG